MSNDDREPSARPASTVAQWITAACAVLLVVGGAAVVVFTFYLSATVLERALGSDDSQAAVRQAVCLAYFDYVLERYDEGLSAEEIKATIDLATEPTSGDSSAVDASGRVDSPELCGSPAEVLRVAGRPGR